MFQDTTPIAEFRGPWGVPIQIGASLILIPIVFVDLFGADADSLMRDLIFVAILVGSIYLHELGHAWGSLIQGVPIKRIMLFGGGGFCERSRSATRFEQELIVLAQKSDVAEELDRLKSHVKETKKILKKGGACGRRLDFMMQEFNREANTLASKSINSDITNAAVELKVLIEQMREQIQNIE